MSNIWKYATLPANQRINLVRSGNSDVYNSEMERTKSVIRSREALGLDTTSQVNWANVLGYNYNLSNAEKMGVSAQNVNKTGYGERLLSSYSNDNSSKKSTYRTQSGASLHRQALDKKRSSEEKQIRSRYAQYKQNAVDSMNDSLSILRENLINKGADVNGGKMISEELRAKSALNDTLASLDASMDEEILSNQNYYQSLIDGKDSSLAQAQNLQLELDSDQQKLAMEYAKWQAEYDLKKQKQETDYDIWLRENGYK